LIFELLFLQKMITVFVLICTVYDTSGMRTAYIGYPLKFRLKRHNIGQYATYNR